MPRAVHHHLCRDLRWFLGATLAALALAGAVGASPVAALTHLNARQASAPRQSVGSIKLSPQAVPLPNPREAGGSGTAERVRVSLGLLGNSGRAITSGALARPITLTVYGPSPAVLTAERSVIRSATSAIYFRYTGGFVANPIIVTAVSGHAFAEMSFQPQNRGFPSASSVTFAMPNTANRNIKSGWHFDVSVGGGPSHGIEMDTGSRGVVVPAATLGPEAVGPGAPGKIEYSSDGKIFTGHFYLAPLTLSVGSATVKTVPIEVLGVEHSSCSSNYPNCKTSNVTGLSMMGVGFDRGGLLPGTPPEISNAFLALTNVVEGSMHPGYIVSAGGVTLGITPADETGYGMIPLEKGGTGPGDWDTEKGCLSFPEIVYPAQCGTVLIDTGISSAILTLPPASRPPAIAGSIPQGEQIRIALPNPASPAFAYGFATGDGGPMTPTSIRWARGSEPFVNTGRRPISEFNYLFDDGSGAVGFEEASPP